MSTKPGKDATSCVPAEIDILGEEELWMAIERGV
jgi:hypothetical protein